MIHRIAATGAYGAPYYCGNFLSEHSVNQNPLKLCTAIALGCVAAGLTACGGGAAIKTPAQSITIRSLGANTVSVWDEIATATLSVPPAATGTAAEKGPALYDDDLATLHVAMYDAVIAVAGTHKPFAITPTTPASGASMEAAANAAAYGVLKRLFPARTNIYQATYDSRLAAIPDGEAKTRGLAIGAEVARGVLAFRANDGRDVALATYVSGTEPGKFRSANPALRLYPHVRPFTLTSAAQFRAPGPPALESAEYARDFNESKTMGSSASTMRIAEQTENARFMTEPPPRFWPRNLRQFATSQDNLADSARLMAMIYVAHADAIIGCFESKYFHEFWRPTSAITLADIQRNSATLPDSAWGPVVPTPNHPEYPAAHSCAAAASMEAIRQFFGTTQVSFKFDSSVANTTVHTFATTDQFMDEVQAARIHGGMHFRTATVHGAELGTKVAKQVFANHFQPR